MAGLVLLALGGTQQAADPPVSYAKDIKPFLNKYCMECHQGASAKAKVKVDSYADLLTRTKKGALVVAGKADQSVLVKVLEGQGGKPMPPKKSAQPTAAEIAKVKAWITAGAKDDSKSAAVDGEQKQFVTLLPQ